MMSLQQSDLCTEKTAMLSCDKESFLALLYNFFFLHSLSVYFTKLNQCKAGITCPLSPLLLPCLTLCFSVLGERVSKL